MNKYSEYSKCRKCGCPHVGTRFDFGVIHRFCGRCGYKWEEFPLDASPKIESDQTEIEKLRALT